MTQALDSETDLLERRREFPTLSKKVHLISHSLGAMPRAAYDALREYGDLWVDRSIEAWRDWLPLVTASADEIGRIIGAPAGTVMMHQNVSAWMGIIASCLDFTPRRDRVVYTDLNFPSVHYVWKEHERLGANVHLVRSDDGIEVDTQKFIDAIDERTAAVVIELVLFRSGTIQDAKAIAKAAHAKGALAIVDAYQAVGTVPMDVVDMDVDFLTGGSVKWLCGGPGAAYCYVRRDLISKLEPRLCGWFSHEEPFAFEMSRVRYRRDAGRFMGGTPSIPALYASSAGRRCVRELGVERIRRKSIRQVGKLAAMAEEAGLEVRSPRDPQRRGGMLCLEFPGSEPAHEELLRRGYMLDWRPGSGIRVSPHFYTTDGELEALLDEIRKIRRT
ncbi:MAG: aminotransferase class V-fold PLP-dependent enzyme [Planctomycetes bacterium]|nr:aminotransferase class V-fold PLP-dependent enzyme [Planctomycetota bacterium]